MRLEWATEITETDFYKRIHEHPVGKTEPRADDFGRWLVAQGGRLNPDLDIDL